MTCNRSSKKRTQKDILYKKKPKGQNPTKFRPLDKKVRNEDIIKTWKLSQYTPLLSLSTWAIWICYKPSQSTCLYLIKPTTTLPVKTLLQWTHILHCTLKWYSLHLLDLWNALLYVHCNLMFWYVEGFQIKNVSTKSRLNGNLNVFNKVYVLLNWKKIAPILCSFDDVYTLLQYVTFQFISKKTFFMNQYWPKINKTAIKNCKLDNLCQLIFYSPFMHNNCSL